jgi:hypothetical protein
MIEEYLRELDSLLRGRAGRRRRILREVEEHLRDDGGDESAIARFGSPAEVATRFNGLCPDPPARVASALVLGGALFVFTVVQGLDDFLPPAPWPSAADAPASLRLTFLGATVAILSAVAAALAALVLPRRLRGPVTVLSCVALGVCIALLCANAILRAGHVTGSPSIAWPIALSVLALAPVAAALFLLSGRGVRFGAAARGKHQDENQPTALRR